MLNVQHVHQRTFPLTMQTGQLQSQSLKGVENAIRLFVAFCYKFLMVSLAEKLPSCSISELISFCSYLVAHLVFGKLIAKCPSSKCAAVK